MPSTRRASSRSPGCTAHPGRVDFLIYGSLNDLPSESPLLLSCDSINASGHFVAGGFQRRGPSCFRERCPSSSGRRIRAKYFVNEGARVIEAVKVEDIHGEIRLHIRDFLVNSEFGEFGEFVG